MLGIKWNHVSKKGYWYQIEKFAMFYFRGKYLYRDPVDKGYNTEIVQADSVQIKIYSLFKVGILHGHHFCLK